jgi:uncharacterized membrane protein
MIKKISRNRRGGVLTLTAIAFPVIIAVMGLCVDIGMIYLSKTKGDMAATAAAEAAEQRLPNVSSAEDLAYQVALSMLDDVGFVSDYDIEVSATATKVDVTIHLQVRTILAHFVNIDILDSYSSASRPL